MITPNTVVRLLTDVPLSPKNEHQLTFNNIHEQADYFTPKTLFSYTDFTYQREEAAIKVPRGYDDLYNVNYIMYQNNNYNGKWFYAFVTNKEYINPNATRLYIEFDVWQTYQFDVELLPSFVEREHCKRWNVDGTPVLNTVDEGLDYGSEYKTVKVDQYNPYGNIFFLVMISKKRMDNDEVHGKKYYPSVNGVAQPLVYYVHPFHLDGTAADIYIDGEGAYLSPILDVLKAVAISEDVVNNLVSMYITDYAGLPMTPNATFPGGWDMNRNNVTTVFIDNGAGGTVGTLHAFNVPTYQEQKKTFPNVYADFEAVTESKLLMHPYTVTILTDFKGNQIEVKNEFLENAALSLSVQGSLGTSNKVAYTLTNYSRSSTIPDSLKKVIGLETAVINNSSNDLPILSDYLSAFLQGNRNSMQTQLDSSFVNGILGTLGSLAGGVANFGNTVSSGVNAYYSIESINSKIKDIKNTPPTLNKMGDNTYFDYGNGITGLYIIKKQVTPEYRKKLSDFFKMYGYKVNELKQPNIRSRQHFNFIKTVGVNIIGNVPHDNLNKIKDLFNTGITFWHTAEIGNYGLANGEV